MQVDRPTVDSDTLNQSFSLNIRNKAVAPNINVTRRIPSISEAVIKVLATFDSQLHSDFTQGNSFAKKSGRFNTADIVTAPV